MAEDWQARCLKAEADLKELDESFNLLEQELDTEITQLKQQLKDERQQRAKYERLADEASLVDCCFLSMDSGIGFLTRRSCARKRQSKGGAESNALRQENSKLMEQLAQSEAETEKLRARVRELEQSTEHAEQQCRQLEMSKENLEDQVQDQLEQVAMVRSDLEERDEIIQRLQDDNKDLLAELSVAKTKLEDLANSMSAPNEATAAEPQAEGGLTRLQALTYCLTLSSRLLHLESRLPALASA
ncbi:uncharacterized protein MONBRDRAFT_30022 [Monosiga brevicollis MX1]|uniref:NUDE domain-containing protein n=1 Tax=Monosiga brevicollis TaxID=81824 RepID=A9VCS8_MONBE|nr:uncharacterized protein MONBRDRAFT_30022 [Monosiga brevicollis MX1]EDQ84647.1 predicted protein [Monosiga brevicollis MX1]|eukprot:XP_001750551.1 hypothetical protein [Monosiga brevicollis MX1]